jgi:hypothetical protein
MRIDDDIKLIWTVKQTSVWLWCSFADLFSNDIEEFDNSEDCFKKYPGVKSYSSYEFIELPGDDMNINHPNYDNWNNSIPDNLKESVLEQINKLKPIEYISDVINEFESELGDDTVTFSIRTWKDAVRNEASNGKFFDINTVFREMDDDVYTDKKFFVTCDHQETFDKILNRYNDKIIYTPKRTFFGDYKTVEGIQDSVIDLLLGGKSKLIVNTMNSSFCDMQWWFGGGNANIKIMNNHPQKRFV